MSSSNYCFLTCIQVRRQVKWSGIPISLIHIQWIPTLRLNPLVELGWDCLWDVLLEVNIFKETLPNTLLLQLTLKNISQIFLLLVPEANKLKNIVS